MRTFTEDSHISRSRRTSGPLDALLHNRLLQISLLAAALIALFFYLNPFQSKQKKHDVLNPVSVSTATFESVPITIKTIGNVLSYSFVNVVPQVSGQLKQVCFKQGDFVNKGQLLFVIDPSPYKASLDQAEGNVARDKAQIKLLTANLQRDIATGKFTHVEKSRYAYLQAQGAVSSEQSEQQGTNADVASAVVLGDKAAITTAQGTLEADMAAADNARILLSWTQIRSPLNGRTGALSVYAGNIVTANSNAPLITINQVQPIYVNFTVPEQYLDAVRKNLSSNTLEVDVLVEGKKKNSVNGQVSFIDNTVNTAAGTVMLRAAFPNVDLKLYPGQFVDVIVSMPADEKSVVIPTRAVQTTQQGTAVFIMQPDNTVRFATVNVARTEGDKVALDSGVKPGEVVVTDGQLQLTPGAKVTVVPPI
jgi:membrane fusion protein, multidrug efflux system